jgi:ATP-binding cassette subfamily B protein RaxB
LDEATSHLDVQNEHKVNQALSHLHLTRIMVAHRPETINAAQRVVEISAGRIVEHRTSEMTEAIVDEKITIGAHDTSQSEKMVA